MLWQTSAAVAAYLKKGEKKNSEIILTLPSKKKRNGFSFMIHKELNSN